MKALQAFCMAVIACFILVSYLEAHQTNVNVEVSVEGTERIHKTQKHKSNIQPEPSAPAAAPVQSAEAEIDSVRSLFRPIEKVFNADSILSRWFRAFKKRWSTTEIARRRATFRDNLQKIIIHNRNPYRWEDLGLNQYSDLTTDEFARTVGTSNVDKFVGAQVNEAFDFDSYVPIPLPRPRPKPIDIDPLTGDGGVMLPRGAESDIDETELDEASGAELDQARTVLTSLNWTAIGKVTPVRDQGTCDSCWAFTASDALSSAYSLKLNQKPLVLSPQYLVDCNNQPDVKYGLANFGCGGGAVQTTFRFLSSNPHILERNYPYNNAPSGKCKAVRKMPRTKFTTQSLDHSYVQVTGADAILQEVSKGPMVIYLNSHGEEFRHYKKGMIADKCDTGRPPNDNRINHAVLLVGYGNEDGADYWLIKNTWNTQWGLLGYAKIRRGVNMCGIETMAMRPIIP